MSLKIMVLFDQNPHESNRILYASTCPLHLYQQKVCYASVNCKSKRICKTTIFSVQCSHVSDVNIYLKAKFCNEIEPHKPINWVTNKSHTLNVSRKLECQLSKSFSQRNYASYDFSLTKTLRKTIAKPILASNTTRTSDKINSYQLTMLNQIWVTWHFLYERL